MDGRGHGRLGQTRGDELEDSHLCGGVLHGDPIGAELEVGHAALRRGGTLGIIEVPVDNLLCEGQGFVPKLASDDPQVLLDGGVDFVDSLAPGGIERGHQDGLVDQCVESGAGLHRERALLNVGEPVSPNVNSLALAVGHLLDDDVLGLLQLAGKRLKGREGPGDGLGPPHGDVEMRGAIVGLAAFPPR